MPFSVPPGAGNDATDDVVSGALLRQLELPALGKLLTRAAPGLRETHDDLFLRTLPQERWLAGRAGLDTRRVPTAPFMRLADLRQRAADRQPDAAQAPPAADLRRQEDGDQGWACLQPVHIHAARDHLVLMHPDQLEIRADEAAALRAAIDDLLRESGIALDAPHPARWYVADDVFGELEATTPVRATGRNIDIWLQAGARARDWRRLQNEIQMTWHDHPVNQAREAEGRLTINSVWLHGGGKLSLVNRLADAVLTDDPFLAGLALAGDSLLDPQPARFEEIAKADGHVMAMLDTAAEAHIAQDWGLWLERMHALDAQWFTPVLAALADGRIMGVTLVLGGENHYAEFTVRRADLRKFWRGMGARGDWRALLSDLAMVA
ncbi:cofactor-independent phosphoglycerate mutase [compost metagenome]